MARAMDLASLQLQEKILGSIRKEGLISRKDLARLGKVSPAIVSRATRALIRKGLIYEKQEGKASRKGGRKPIYLTFNSQSGYLLGLAVGSYEVKAVLTDLAENVLVKEAVRTNADGVIKQIISLVQRILNRNKKYRQDMRGFGIGLPGVVDRTSGTALFSANLPSLNGVNVKKVFENEFKRPVKVVNSGELTVIAEKYLDKNLTEGTIQCLEWGNGIGLGVLFGGEEIITGKERGDWDFGHITVQRDGALCKCSRRGCLEAYCGSGALLKKAQEKIKEYPESKLALMVKEKGLDMEVMANAARAGCSVARTIFEEAARLIGKNLSFPVQYLGSGMIILTGGILLNTLDITVEPLKEALKESIALEDYQALKFKVSSLGKFSGALGGVKLISHEIFKTPFLHLTQA